MQPKSNGNVTLQNFQILNNCRETGSVTGICCVEWYIRSCIREAEPFLMRRHIQAPKGSQHYYSKKHADHILHGGVDINTNLNASYHG